MINQNLKYIATIILSFFLGGILFSYNIPKWLKGVDTIRDSDDHNPGTYNAFKLAGWKIGLLCVLCDVAKGFISIFYIYNNFSSNSIIFSIAMVAPVLGHAIAPLYKIHGGKCIAVSFGVLLGLIPHSFIVFVLAFWYILFSTIFKVNPNSKRSTVTFTIFSLSCICFYRYTGNFYITLGCILISSIVIYRHNSERIVDMLDNRKSKLKEHLAK